MKRISWIDIARGFGILFVIYAHGLNSHSIRYFFYAFHMPLFFFLSGIVFHVKKHEGFMTFLKKSAKNILLPYLLFAYASYVLWYFTLNTTHFSPADTQQQLVHLLLGSGKDKYFVFNNVLWFLPCLFVTRISFALITHFFSSRKIILIVLFLFSIVGYLFSVLYPKLGLPFGAEVALNAIVFFGMGYLWQTQSEKTVALITKYAFPLFLVSLITCIIVATISFNTYHQQMDMRMSHLNNYFYFYTGAISGVVACVALSVFLRSNRLLEYLGRYSLILFSWHLVLFSYFSKILSQFMSDEQIRQWDNLYLTPLYSIASILLILGIYYLYNQTKIQIRKRLLPAFARS